MYNDKYELTQSELEELEEILEQVQIDNKKLALVKTRKFHEFSDEKHFINWLKEIGIKWN